MTIAHTEKGKAMSRYIDADAIKEKKWQAESEACFYALEDVVSVTDIEEAPSIDIVRCKECASYCGEGNKCLWGLLTVDMGYCHHGYRGGDCIAREVE